MDALSVHIYAVTVAHGNIYTFLHLLMWVFFLKMCKICTFFYFSILEDYRWADVVALNENQSNHLNKPTCE